MDFNDLVQKTLLSISRQIERKPRDTIAELATKNAHKSTFAITNTFCILSEELKNNIFVLIKDLSQTKIKIKHFKKLRIYLREFIDTEFERHKQYLVMRNIYCVGSVDHSEFIQKEMDEVLSVVEIKLLILEKTLSDRRYVVIWDISKIIISALLGGIIGAYLRYLLA